jgi:hypothetical protein
MQHRSASPGAPKSRRASHILSMVLFVAAIGFAAAAVIVWYRDQSSPDNETTPPTAEAGVYGLINVLTALQDADIEADYGRSPATAASNQLDQPGQNLRVGETNVFIFIFPGADAASATAARESAAASLDPATMTLQTTSGQDVTNGEPLSIFEGANIIAVMVGGDADLQSDVQAVIEGLP